MGTVNCNEIYPLIRGCYIGGIIFRHAKRSLAMMSATSLPYIDTNFSGKFSHNATSQTYGDTVARTVSLVLPAILVFVGIPLNIMLYITLRSQPFLKSSVFVVLKAYTWSCVLALFFDTLLQWLFIMLEATYIADWSDEICRVWMFFINLVSHVPGWLVVVMVIDRYIHVMHSSRAMSVCNTFTGTVTVIFVCIALGAVSIHSMWTYEVSKSQNRCTLIPKGARQMDPFAWNVLTDSIFYFIPQLIICVFIFVILLGCCSIGCYQTVAMRDGSLSNREITIIVLILAFSYILLMLPSCVMKIEVIKIISGTFNPGMAYFIAELLSQFAIMTSRAVSPIIILSSSKTCRQEFVQLWKHIVSLCQFSRRRSRGKQYTLTENGSNPKINTTPV